jgi:hypothetical protein
MTGFSLSVEEVDSVCGRMRAQVDGVRERVAAWDADVAEASLDGFGGAGGAAVAQLYRQVLTELVPSSVHQYRDSARAMTDQLQSVLRAYRSSDEDAAERLQAGGR